MEMPRTQLFTYLVVIGKTRDDFLNDCRMMQIQPKMALTICLLLIYKNMPMVYAFFSALGQ